MSNVMNSLNTRLSPDAADASHGRRGGLAFEHNLRLNQNESNPGPFAPGRSPLG